MQFTKSGPKWGPNGGQMGAKMGVDMGSNRVPIWGKIVFGDMAFNCNTSTTRFDTPK